MKPAKIILKKMGTAKESVIQTAPPPAWMSGEAFFKAEFCGSDTTNFIYIRAADTGSVENYTSLRTFMDQKYGKLGKKNLPQAEIVPDGYVVLKEGPYFHRAKVTRKNDDLGLIYCLKIDEGTCAVVASRQIFPITEDLMKIACCTIRCKLQGMDFFDDLPHLELGYKLIKLNEIMSRPLYSVEVLGILDDVPRVNLSRYGMGLANAVQKFIPMLCTPQVPKAKTPFKGEILYANMKANVWIRQYADDGLFSKIVETLERYKTTMDNIKKDRTLDKRSLTDCGYSTNSDSIDPSTSASMSSSADPDFFLMPDEMWKEKYFGFPNGIFVSEYLDELYRVKVVKYLQKNKVEVEFIDFGNKQVLNPKKLIPVRKIDQNLAFIPPQCLKARLHGFYRMNTFYFWRFLPQSLSIVIKDSKWDEECGMEVDIVGQGVEGGTSLSETWRTSSPDKLALCILKPLEKSTGENTDQKESQILKRHPPSELKQRGGLYKSEGIAVNERLRRLTLISGTRWR